MHTPASFSPSSRSGPLLLIHNLYNYGHFLVYAETLTQWGLAKGFRVALLGRGLVGTRYARRYAAEERVALLDVAPNLRLDQGLDAPSKQELAIRAREEVLEAQRTLRPEASVLLSTDELLYHAEHTLPSGFRFAAPTVGVVTFGHRDCYLASKDLYALALDRALAEDGPFRAVLTLDEYQVATVDPGQERLVFLPDIYADPPGWSDPAGDCPDAAALGAFLSASPGPVLPLLGKLDQRKNALWTLRAVSRTPGARCVVLGERVPGPDDAAIDALLAGLAAEGRAFVRGGYVPEALFRMVLGHPGTPFVPLPYACHYGSSGPQLQAFAAGKPTLAPDVGLMAWRIQTHGLGLCHAHGDEADFRRAFAELLAQGPEPYAAALARFMDFFRPEARNAQLDRAFGLGPAPDLLPGLTAEPPSPPRAELLRQGLDLARSGRLEEALERYAGVLSQRPGDAVALLRRALALIALGRETEAVEALRLCLEHGGGAEFRFVLRAQIDRLEATLEVQEAESSLKLTPQALLRAFAEDGVASAGDFDAELWWRLGSALARMGRLGGSASAYANAVAMAPQELDYRLNLSDVLRYQRRLDEADAALNELAALAPGHPGLHHKRGQVLFERGELQRAREEFLREPQDSPHAGPAQEYLARLERTP